MRVLVHRTGPTMVHYYSELDTQQIGATETTARQVNYVGGLDVEHMHFTVQSVAVGDIRIMQYAVGAAICSAQLKSYFETLCTTMGADS